MNSDGKRFGKFYVGASCLHWRRIYVLYVYLPLEHCLFFANSGKRKSSITKLIVYVLKALSETKAN